MKLTPIGIIHSPYKMKGEAPSQGRRHDKISRIEIFKDYTPALKDTEVISHFFVLYWADKADRTTQQTNTPHDDKPHGVFATRSPNRPNPINLGIAELVAREGNVLVVKGLDALDQSMLIDLKPYSSEIDSIPGIKVGWRKIVKP